jgi:2-polyprenyl-6-hydroxyphenyl methylase/3-demethylubiquinone-9 3-methyltransferase
LRQFDFGQNWSDYSAHALTEERVRQARSDFARLMAMAGVELPGTSFADIGFGQGLGLLSAVSMGARAVGCDINPLCVEVLGRNGRLFPGMDTQDIPIVIGSILDPHVVESLRQAAPDPSGYYVVHSWGVLHHTGRMWQAIDNAASLVRPGGTLVIALYNRHWTSPAWALIKQLYMRAPRIVQRAMIATLYPVIFAAKWAVTRRNPRRMERGMDFYYDVVDWVGGYPYEYASIEEVASYMATKGFASGRSAAAAVPTGCNEFVFVRAA